MFFDTFHVFCPLLPNFTDCFNSMRILENDDALTKKTAKFSSRKKIVKKAKYRKFTSKKLRVKLRA